ncbi:MAG: zinc ABC transporter substrate-binding protein [Simkaniaceae bacterium]|nr:zinc ABC transporter substrate-binding protein [Simkaniaceae bacterium]
MKKLFLILLVACFSCVSTVKKRNKPLVLVSIPAYEQIMHMIGCDEIAIASVVEYGFDPHIFESTPQDMSRIQGARLWFGVGESFEPKLLPVLKEESPQLEYVDLISAITPIEEDRHIWTDPVGMIAQAKLITDGLCQAFPEHEATFKTGYEKVKVRLQVLNKNIERKITPYKGNAILMAHPSLSYFCRRYDLVQLAVEVEGKQPLPKDINKLFQRFRKDTVRCCFTQEGNDNRAAVMLAQALQVPIYPLDPMSPEYFDTMLKIAVDIAHDQS